MPLKPIGELSMRVFNEPSSFGYKMQFYTGGVVGTSEKLSVAVDMKMETVERGHVIPDQGTFPVSEQSLIDIGKFLLGQGLITAPVTEQERKDHAELKIKYEMQDKLIEQMREQLKDSNTRLSEIAGVVKIAQQQMEAKK